MTTQQLTLMLMAAAGAAVFLIARRAARTLAPGASSFLPASVISWRGIVSYVCTGVSWAGILLAGVSVLILVFE